MGRLKNHPALTLFFIAPVFAELFSGSSPLNEFINPLTLLILAMLYGSGAIIARELTIRWEKGWPSLLLLGFAYGIYEEGLVIRSFFNPNWMDLGSLGVYGRVWGVNWVWAYHLTVFHALVSIAASVVFVEIVFSEHRANSWITRRQWWYMLWAFLLLMLPLGKALNPYNAPDRWIALSWLAILALVGLARWMPSPHPRHPRRDVLPRPRRFFGLAYGGAFTHQILIHLGADRGAYPFPVALLLVLLFDLLVLYLARRWSGDFAAWDDRHRMAFLSGILAFFLSFPLLVGAETPIMYFSNPVFLFLLWWGYRRVARRVADEQME